MKHMKSACGLRLGTQQTSGWVVEGLNLDTGGICHDRFVEFFFSISPEQ
jgi:hypothetical protein